MAHVYMPARIYASIQTEKKMKQSVDVVSRVEWKWISLYLTPVQAGKAGEA